MHDMPLNFDNMFKKVFSHTRIAKPFLQEHLGIKITKIAVWGVGYDVSGDDIDMEVIMEISYRCRVNGESVIIDIKNPNYEKNTFEASEKDKITAEVIKRFKKNMRDLSEPKYVSDLYQYEHLLEQKERELEEMRKALVHSKTPVQEVENQEERIEKMEMENNKLFSKIVKCFLDLGKDVPYIAKVMGWSVDETSHFAQQKSV